MRSISFCIDMVNIIPVKSIYKSNISKIQIKLSPAIDRIFLSNIYNVSKLVALVNSWTWFKLITLYAKREWVFITAISLAFFKRCSLICQQFHKSVIHNSIYYIWIVTVFFNYRTTVNHIINKARLASLFFPFMHIKFKFNKTITGVGKCHRQMYTVLL